MHRTIEQLEELVAACADRHARARLLLELGAALRFVDPARSRSLAEQSRDLAGSAGDRVLEAEACLLYAGVSLPMSQFESARQHLDRALAIADDVGDELLRTKVLGRMVSYHHWTGETAAAIKLAGACIPVLERYRAYDVLVGLLLTVAGAHGLRQQHTEALEALFRAAEISREQGFEKELATAYSTIGELLGATGEYADALGYLEQSLTMSRRLDDMFGQAMSHYHLGNCRIKLSDPENGERHLREAARLFHELEFRKLEVYALDGLGAALLQQQKTEQALECFDRALRILPQLGEPFVFGHIINCISMVMIERGEYDPAEHYLREALRRAEQTEERRLQFMLCEVMSKLYEHRGMYDCALRYHKRYAEMKSGFMEVEARTRVADIQSRFQLEMLEKEREIQELETARLREEAEHRARELTAATLQIVENGEQIRKLKEQLRAIRRSGSSNVGIALKRIESELDPKNDWARFTRQFERVHPEFGGRLVTKYPALTPTEVRICSLLKVNLSTKEIANLLAIEVRTVEIHRGRIRKKLGLTRKDSLGLFLTAL